MTLSPEMLKALSAVAVDSRIRYLRIGDQYWDFLGIAQDGNARLYLRKRPPYWRTVKDLQPDYSWKDANAPGGFHPFTITLAAIAALLFAVAQIAFGNDPNPGKVQWMTGASVVLLTVALGSVLLPPSTYFDGYDQWQEPVPDLAYEAHKLDVAAKQDAQKARQVQLAIWSELHGINQAAHPGHNPPVPPYGSMPPQ